MNEKKSYGQALRTDWRKNEIAKVIFAIGFLVLFLFGGLWFFASVINQEVLKLDSVFIWPSIFWVAAIAHWLLRPAVSLHYMSK